MLQVQVRCAAIDPWSGGPLAHLDVATAARSGVLENGRRLGTTGRVGLTEIRHIFGCIDYLVG